MSVFTAAILVALLPLKGASAQGPAPASQPATGTPQSHNDAMAARQLKVILDQHDTARFAAFTADFGRGSSQEWPSNMAPLDPDIERQIVAHFRDEQWRKPLMYLVSLRPYTSRELFDLLYAHIADPDKVDYNTHWYNLVCHTSQPKIEARLLAATPKLDADGRYVILSCLARRKYTPAVPAIVAYISTNTESSTNVYGLLGLIGSKEAAAALIGELKRLHSIRQPTPRDFADEGAILQALSAIPTETPLDAPLVASLVSGDKAVGRGYLQFLKARPEPAAARTLINYLSDDRLRADTLDLLCLLASPKALQDALQRIEELHAGGKLPDANYRGAKQLLEHPEVRKRQLQTYAANDAVEKEAGPLRTQLRQLAPLMQADPGRFVAQASEIADALDAVADHHPEAGYSRGLRSEVLAQRRIIALLQRFVLRQPLKAIEANQKILAAPDARGEAHDLSAALQIAEIYQYELADKGRAIEYYRKARDTVDQQHWNGLRNPDAVAAWMKEGLIDGEIAFLTTGKTFSGAVTHRDVEGAGYALFLDAATLLMLITPPPAHVSPIAETVGDLRADPKVLGLLQPMPASYVTAMAAVIAMSGAVDANAVVKLLEAKDPVHYASACALGIYAANATQGPNETAMLSQVIAEFGKANHISVHTEPDPRHATPQGTWDLFIASLKSGDRDTALGCFTGNLQVSLGELFRRKSNADLKQMASEFGPLVPSNLSGGSSDDFQEFAVTRKLPQGDQAAFVYFVREGSEWLVQSM